MHLERRWGFAERNAGQQLQQLQCVGTVAPPGLTWHFCKASSLCLVGAWSSQREVHEEEQHTGHTMRGDTLLTLLCALCCAGDLDPAVIDRMDEALEFQLPSTAERCAARK